MRAFSGFAGLLILAAHATALADTYPPELYPSNAAVTALNGTTDSPTGLEYIPQGTSPSSAIPLPIRINRMFHRLFAISEDSNQGRVVKTATARIGVFPIDYQVNGAREHFAGATDQGAGILTGDDTFYVYIDAANALQIVTDAAGWPADVTQFTPLAEVTVVSSAITAITNRRGWARNIVPGSGGAASTGTNELAFIVDADNGGAGVSTEWRHNRGSTDDDAAVRWNETDDRFEFYLDTVNNIFAPTKALTLELTQTTGTAPLTIASTTLCTNLNADLVDGLSFTAPAAANGLAYSTSTSAIAFTAAAAAGNVLFADGSGVPTWAAPGATSGIQAYDADLTAIAGVALTGLWARTGAGTAAARQITGSGAISVADGDGVSGHPTISIAGMAENGAIYGVSGGGISSTSAGTDNTVLAGRTGNSPVFRKVVNTDIDTAAAIALSKLANGTSAQMIVADGSGVPAWRSISGDMAITTAGVVTDSATPTFTVGSEVGNQILVTLQIKLGDGSTNPAQKCLVRAWLSDSPADEITATAPDAMVADSAGGAFKVLQTVVADKDHWIITSATGGFAWEIEKSGAQTYYYNVSSKDRIYSSGAITFAP